MKNFQQSLLSWYRQQARSLPWRNVNDPYLIWISEVMLQQTRVETVIPYFQKFAKKFKTISDLARAKEHAVLQEWQGLGYYRRAKLLHQAAQDVVEKYNGQLPNTLPELRSLPGFGAYTAGAVASIAFSIQAAAVDGNVKRVLSRVFATHDDIQPFADDLAKNDSPPEWTQALMELGALICVPRNPKCLICPARSDCRAYQLGTVQDYPGKKERKSPTTLYAQIWILKRKDEKLLIRKRPEGGRWAGLWEFPTIESKTKPKNRPDFENTIELDSITKLGSFTHQLTHRHLKVDVVSANAGAPTTAQFESPTQWISLMEIKNFPISRLQSKAFEIYQKAGLP